MIGETVGHYRITEKLGSGGMGVVYRAVDTRLGRTVALKFLPPDLTRDESSKRRFIGEAQAASSIDHPNICTIHDIGETGDGRLYICMACYEGQTLKEMTGGGTLPLQKAVRIAAAVARGLAKAHEREIVHRDIKPANVFATEDGGVRILDFGLAKLAGTDGVTAAGTTVGTVSYMSPEQAGGDVDHRTDIWSLGVTLYEIVTGTTPFHGDTQQATIHSILTATPPPVHVLRDDVPPEFERIIVRCLEKDPDRRYQKAAELADDLERLAADLATAAEEETAPMRVRPGRSRLWIAAFAAALIAGLFLHPGIRRALTETGPPGGLPSPRIVAVLPLTGSGGAEGIEHLRMGLLSYLGLRLHAAERHEDDLVVLPVDEAVERGIVEPEDARRRAGATLALIGSLDRRGGLVRCSLELVDTSSGARLGAREFDERLGNVAVLEDTLVASVLAMLDVAPEHGGTELPGGTTVPTAFESYIQGVGMLVRARGREESADAVRMLERAVSADPGFALAHAALGEARWHLSCETSDFGDPQPAVEACERAARLAPELALPHEVLGRIHMQAGSLDQAAESFRSALSDDPLFFTARLGLADALEARGEDEEAEQALRRGIALRPEDCRQHYALGVFLAMHGRCEEAIAELEAVVARAPEHETAHSTLGAVFYYLERWDEARRALARSLEIRPDYTTFSNLATLHFQEGKYADAAEMYEHALALDDSDYRVWGNAGAAYLWLPGERERALEMYRRAVDGALDASEEGPHDPYIQAHLASYYGELGRRDDALARVDSALALAPDDPEVLFHVGHTYEVLGRRDTALEWIRRAVELGYSRAQIERTPGLRALCADDRYDSLLEGEGREQML